ncbi:MAG: Rho termination factor N-terminal domain-containing protein, partial [Treponema sp.]|nr:Rho termination factor N-terminal domain-containing protein [Treponema sp.]
MDEENQNTSQENAEEKPKRRRVVKKAAAKAPAEEKAESAEAAETPAAAQEASEQKGHFGFKGRDSRGSGRFQNNRRNFRPNHENMAPDNTPTPENSPDYDQKPRLEINELTKKSMIELREMAAEYGFSADDLAPMKKQDLIFVILKAHTEHGGIIFASGALEILPDGYGFLRSPQNSYLPGPDDIYISPSQIRLFNLKTGDTVYGQT